MKKLMKCTSSWKKINGVYGILFEASNKNKIFLPAAGFRHDASLSYAGDYAEYWSSSLVESMPSNAYDMHLYSVGMYVGDYDYRYNGRPVRPVLH